MKLKLVSLLTLAAILLAAAGGSIAYFTATGTAANVIAAGNVNIALHDETASGSAFSQEGLSALMPGDTADKIVYVENTGDNAFYTRVKLYCSARTPGGSALSFDNIALNIDTVHWQSGTDGWYYYSAAVEQGAQTEPLFTEVTLLPETGNDYMDADVSIRIVAQAVQKANNGATVWQAAGWPAE
jgi:predicted ribosomally synthesized peptide with SipW-like signal peptide